MVATHAHPFFNSAFSPLIFLSISGILIDYKKAESDFLSHWIVHKNCNHCRYLAFSIVHEDKSIM